MKRILPLVLVIVLAATLFASCGSASPVSLADSEPQTETATSETQVSAVVADVPEVLTETEAENSVSEGQEPAEEMQEVPDGSETLEYFPVNEDITLTIMMGTAPIILSLMDWPLGIQYFQEMGKRTGIQLEPVIYTFENMNEVLSLAMASNSLADINSGVNNIANYDYCVEQGLILEMNDYIDEYMPNYKAMREGDEEYRKASISDDGIIGGIYGFCKGRNVIEVGPVIRQDWLDELGLESPVTYDEYYDVLTAFKEHYNCSTPIHVNSGGAIQGNYLAAGYGVASDVFMGAQPFLVVDGEVKYSPCEEGYREYLTMIHQWYEEGLINHDFMSQTMNDIEDGVVYSDNAGIFCYKVGGIANLEKSAPTEGFDLAPIKDARKTRDQVNHLRQRAELITSSVCLGSNCSNIEAACRWLDYNYTEEGLLLNNYGVEGVSFEYDKNGEPVFTDVVANNPNYGSTLAMAYYCNVQWVTELDNKERQASFLDMSYCDLWGEDDNTYQYDTEMYFLTTEESEIDTDYYGDIATYVQESQLAFIIGNKPLSEFDDFVKNINDMGIEHCIEVRQAAYERYESR